MKATVRVQADRRVAKASPLLRGHFIEHVHRCMTGGVHEEGSPLSDERGFRKDVLEYFKALNPGVLRYPGGNFSCDYNWRHGVLPKDQRPTRYNYGTRTVESCRFGTHEFIEYCREAGCEPMLTINAGNGTPKEAADWVAYCNRDDDHDLAKYRRANGCNDPFGVKYWCIGNEIYGDWVPRTKTGEEYGNFARETAKFMRWSDPDIKLVGMSTGTFMPDWDRAAIDATVDIVDFISLHIYVGRLNYYNCVGSPAVIKRGIDLVQGVIEHAAYKKGVTELPKISLDEYNVWYRTGHFPHGLEERYSLQDAITLAGVQNVLFRNADVVGMACISMLTNCLGITKTSPTGSFRESVYWVLKMVGDYFADDVVDCFVDCPTFSCHHPKYFAGVTEIDEEGQEVETEMQKITSEDYEGLTYLDICSMVDEETGELILSVVNRHETETIEADIQILGKKIAGNMTGHMLTGDSAKAENSFDEPDAIMPVTIEERAAKNQFAYSFPRQSYTVLRLSAQVK